MAITKINKLPDDAVASVDIAGSTLVNADVSPSAAIAQSKIDGLTTSFSSSCSSLTTVNNTITSACAQNSKNYFREKYIL